MKHSLNDVHRLGKALGGGSLGSLPALFSHGDMPADLLRESARRMGLACLIYAFTYTAAFYGPAIATYLADGTIADHVASRRSIVAVASILLALLTFALSRIDRIPATTLLDLGLVFLVVGSAGISVPSVYGSFSVWDPELFENIGYFGIPWECNWIVIFPLIAPNVPRKILAASLLAASPGLVTILVSKANGATSAEAPLSFFVTYYLFSTYLCAFLAYLGSKVLWRYGARLKEAREFGQYELEELLGKGGMGEVWRASHRMLARPAAIKLIRPESLGDDEAARRTVLRRFEREARATARLRSVHTIDVFDFGHADDGSFYYVMELLDGMDLDTLVKHTGSLPPGRVVSLLRQACHSLGDAHARGMVHRDVKPANLFVCRLGPDVDFLKVLDFGLVKSADGFGGDATKLTREGVTFGTPGCMPPEMAVGGRAIDARADVYGLGCVAYWLLTGVPVFVGETPLATVLHHVKTEPVPPSQRSEIAVPEALEAIVIDCLAKDPADRPQSAAALDRRLADCELPQPWTPADAAAWWSLHRPIPEEGADEPLGLTDSAAIGPSR
jgi:serine/threonine-protein kinase